LCSGLRSTRTLLSFSVLRLLAKCFPLVEPAAGPDSPPAALCPTLLEAHQPGALHNAMGCSPGLRRRARAGSRTWAPAAARRGPRAWTRPARAPRSASARCTAARSRCGRCRWPAAATSLPPPQRRPRAPRRRPRSRAAAAGGARQARRRCWARRRRSRACRRPAWRGCWARAPRRARSCTRCRLCAPSARAYEKGFGP